MDKRTVFAEGLTFPNGVLPWKGGLLVTCAPDFLYLKDTDGDGRADERRVVLTGFDTKGSTQLRVNAPTLGPDGWIYLAAGLGGGSITAPEHPEKPALKMTGDLRWHPHTGEFENVDGRSQYGMAFDDFGRRFICMNRVPVQHVVLSSKMLRRNPRLAFSETVQDCNERTVKTGLRGGGDGVRLFPISANITTADSHAGSFSAACGIQIWRGGALPERYRGCAFTCDPTANLVHVDKLTPRGATFSAEPLLDGREFLASGDDWFRPVFLASGPDGALYIADMYRKVIEHPDYLPQEVRKRTDFESGKEMGRIWRLIRRDRRPNPPAKRADDSPEKLVEALGDARAWSRDTAFRLLLETDRAAAVAALQSALTGKTEPLLTSTIVRALAALNALDDEAVQRATEIPEPDGSLIDGTLVQLLPAVRARRAILELRLIDGSEAFSTSGVKIPSRNDLVGWISPRWRLHAALRFGDLRDGGATAALAALALHDPGDRWMRAAILSGAADREEQLVKAVFAQRVGDAKLPVEMLHELGRMIGASSDAAIAMKKAQELIALSETGDFSGTLSLLTGFADAVPAVFRGPRDGMIEDVVRQAERVLAAADESPILRGYAAALLGCTSFERSGAALFAALSGQSVTELHLAAVRALAGFDHPEIPKALLDPARWAAYTPSQRSMVLETLLARVNHLPGLLALLESEALPVNALSTQHRQRLLKHADLTIRTRAEKLFGKPAGGDRAAAVEEAKAALALAANPAHGREVFRNVCATCHRLEREGFAVGPDLFEIRNQPKENILFHLVAPDAEISPPFSGYLAETKDGRTLSGVLAAETATSVLLRMPGGAEETLLRSNLTKLEALPNSLMPPGLEAAMSKQDLADLLAFLKGEAAR
jgi:putative membrane-bound dehydrogenase-like protein